MKSMDSVDVSNRKPRRFKGTPTYKLRNVLSIALVAYTLATGALFMFTPITRNIRNVFEVLGTAKQYESEETTPEERHKNNSMFLAYSSVSSRHQPNLEEEVKTRAGI